MHDSHPCRGNRVGQAPAKTVQPAQLQKLIRQVCFLFVAALVLPMLALAADYDLGELAKAGKLEPYNRKLDPAKAGSPEAVFLDAAANDGLAWVSGVNFSQGTIELEIKGKDEQGRSFVGIAFHGQDDRAFDAIYLRPFNFQASAPERQSHAIQYVAMPDNDWNVLRTHHPGKYEAAITPAPAPESWVKLKLLVEASRVSAFVNGSEKPALTVEPLNDRAQGKLGLWVGNGSDGWFRNLKVTPAAK